MDRNCFDCMFWDRQKHIDTEVGLCRRREPAPVQWAQTQDDEGNRGERDAVWPLTNCDDWCGEFRPSQPALADDFEKERQSLAGTKGTPF